MIFPGNQENQINITGNSRNESIQKTDGKYFYIPIGFLFEH